jgi:large subunit ribosomal protein L30
MNKLKVTQIKSGIGKPERQKRTLRALGIKHMHQTVEVTPTPQILGMIEKIRHLVTVEEM